jgi:hypothetical protein
MSTGPTGTTLEDAIAAALSGPSGLTGANDVLMAFAMNTVVAMGPTGPSPSVMAMFPNAATGPVEAPTIVTMEELLASHEAVVAQEAADTVTLTRLSAPTRDGYRTHLFHWAALGFPDLYIIQSVSVTPPSICADGVTREIGKYAEYLMGKDLGAVVTSLSELMTGIRPSWSVSGNTLRIHVTKAN